MLVVVVICLKLLVFVYLSLSPKLLFIEFGARVYTNKKVLPTEGS